jgi:hypothetical protein
MQRHQIKHTHLIMDQKNRKNVIFFTFQNDPIVVIISKHYLISNQTYPFDHRQKNNEKMKSFVTFQNDPIVSYTN